MLALDFRLRVLILGLLGSQTLLHLVGIVVLVATLLRGQEVVMVLLWQGLLLVYRLLRRVVMVLVDFAVDGCGCLLVLRAIDGFLLHGRCYLFVYGGIVVAILGAGKV